MFAHGFAFSMDPRLRGDDEETGDGEGGKRLPCRVLDRRVDARHKMARRSKDANVSFRKMLKRGAGASDRPSPFVANCSRKLTRTFTSEFSQDRKLRASFSCPYQTSTDEAVRRSAMN